MRFGTPNWYSRKAELRLVKLGGLERLGRLEPPERERPENGRKDEVLGLRGERFEPQR